MLTLRAYFNLLLRNTILSTPELDESKGVGPATLQSANTSMHVTASPRGIITTNSTLGRKKGKGWHDKDLNVEFMGIFNLKKRSESQNRLFKLEQAEKTCFPCYPAE